MKMHFSVCNKCKTFDYKELINILRDRYPNSTFDLKCQSYCGPGSIRPFVALNEQFIDANNIVELLIKVEKAVGEYNVK